MTTKEAPPTRPGSAADVVYRWLAKGRRTDFQMAEKRWGMSRGAYHQAVRRLAQHLDIATDRKIVTRKLAGGSVIRRQIASHQLVR